jgi:hypothetical protein
MKPQTAAFLDLTNGIAFVIFIVARPIGSKDQSPGAQSHFALVVMGAPSGEKREMRVELVRVGSSPPLCGEDTKNE